MSLAMCGHRDLLLTSKLWGAEVRRVVYNTRRLLLGCYGRVRHYTLILNKLNMCTWRRAVSWSPVHNMF